MAVSDTSAVTLPKATTLANSVNDKYYRRRTADNDTTFPKAQWGVAAPSSSALFKSPAAMSANKQSAKRWDSHLSAETKARKSSTLKAAARFLSKPGLISLGGGLPSSALFPFAELSAKVPTGAIGSFDEQSTEESGITLTSGKNDLAEGKSIYDIATAFNYGQGTGSSQVMRWVTEHTELVHSPPYADWECNLTIGSTSAMDIALRIFTERGDAVLTECYTFPAAIEAMVPMGITPIGVPLDGEGMMPDELESILANWDAQKQGAPRPKLMYLIPTGQNPTGATMSLPRRRAIYQICQTYDVYIFEDEPYYFLQMPDYVSGGPFQDDSGISHEAFLKSLVPSFLSIDVDGRVLRMDSFSKVLAPGTRLGWITASKQIVDLYRMHVDCSTQGPCGMSQLLLFKMLDEHWGHGGYLDWLKYIRKEYTIRRDAIVKACEQHLPTEIVSWVPPKAGMFVSSFLFLPISGGQLTL
jgi:aromatic amino acid aminotransferase I